MEAFEADSNQSLVTSVTLVVSSLKYLRDYQSQISDDDKNVAFQLQPQKSFAQRAVSFGSPFGVSPMQQSAISPE